MIPAKEFEGELWIKASDHHQAIKEALAQPSQEPDELTIAYMSGLYDGKKAEREACAKIVEADPSYDWHKFACEAAAVIRARGNT